MFIKQKENSESKKNNNNNTMSVNLNLQEDHQINHNKLINTSLNSKKINDFFFFGCRLFESAG